MLILCAGCGRVGFDIRAADATIGDGELGRFSTPIALAALNSATADDDASLTADMLEIIFDSARTGAPGNLFTASRPTLASPWSAAVEIPQVSSGDDEDGAHLTADGLLLTFASNRPGGSGNNDLYYSTRADRQTAWTAPIRIAELASSGNDDRFAITADHLAGMFASNRAGGDFDLFVTQRSSPTAMWDPPVIAGELATSGLDADPALDPSGTVLYFTSNRDGNDDIYTATRPSPSEPFGEAVPVAEINSIDVESDPWISPDQRTIIFTRGDTTDRDLYISVRD